jgi:hypothetical protein
LVCDEGQHVVWPQDGKGADDKWKARKVRPVGWERFNSAVALPRNDQVMLAIPAIHKLRPLRTLDVAVHHDEQNGGRNRSRQGPWQDDGLQWIGSPDPRDEAVRSVDDVWSGQSQPTRILPRGRFASRGSSETR